MNYREEVAISEGGAALARRAGVATREGEQEAFAPRWFVWLWITSGAEVAVRGDAAGWGRRMQADPDLLDAWITLLLLDVGLEARAQWLKETLG